MKEKRQSIYQFYMQNNFILKIRHSVFCFFTKKKSKRNKIKMIQRERQPTEKEEEQ
jgi:hypothetical protein